MRAQKTLALHNLHLNHYHESTADREGGRRRGAETNVFAKVSKNEWQLESSVTIHERDTR